MIFRELPLGGAFVIEPERLEDERGFFARSWCEVEFARHGLEPALAQCNISWNRSRGTLRGLHFQAPPHAEAKLVRCTRGAAFDVLVDLRPDSASFGRWHGVVIDAGSRQAVYAPAGFAHGFETLADDTELFYQMTVAYDPASARGIRWDDPALDIAWPIADPILSPRDRAWPSLAEAGLMPRAATPAREHASCP